MSDLKTCINKYSKFGSCLFIFNLCFRFIPPNEKRFKCKHCGKKYADGPGMYRHITSFHRGVRHNCEQCPKTFVSLGGLKTHKKVSHCNGNTSSKIGMQLSKKAKVSCDICFHSFANNNLLSGHVELKHFPNKTTCPYGCPGEFGHESEWATHLERCTSDKMVNWHLSFKNPAFIQPDFLYFRPNHSNTNVSFVGNYFQIYFLKLFIIYLCTKPILANLALVSSQKGNFWKDTMTPSTKKLSPFFAQSVGKGSVNSLIFSFIPQLCADRTRKPKRNYLPNDGNNISSTDSKQSHTAVRTVPKLLLRKKGWKIMSEKGMATRLIMRMKVFHNRIRF